MQKVQGVESVKVSLNEGLTILELKADNTVTLESLRKVIKNNGFVSKEAHVVARGASADGKVFEVSGTRERLDVDGAPQQSGDAWRITVRAPK